ncbi:MAG: tRNA lysidine(34) synthetase TilS [Phycisphaerales bacterium JB061]
MDPAVQRSIRRIVAQWRQLTGGSAVRDPGRPTLLALSGGPDSSALLLALASCKPARIVAAHIRHNLRPDASQNADLESARSLSERLGVPFVSRDIHIEDHSNPEAEARRLRYAVLTDIADESGCRFVATGHHADDQLETMLMTLTRGSGPGGLSGIRPSRPLSESVALVRPALVCSRTELLEICHDAGHQPAHDETNDDLTRRRAWLRARVIPELLSHADEELPARLMSAQSLLADAHTLGIERAEALMRHSQQDASGVECPIELLAPELGLVIGEWLRLAAGQLQGDAGRDSLGWKHLEPIVARVTSGDMHAKTFDLKGLRVTVTNRFVRVESFSRDVTSRV